MPKDWLYHHSLNTQDVKDIGIGVAKKAGQWFENKFGAASSFVT